MGAELWQRRLQSAAKRAGLPTLVAAGFVLAAYGLYVLDASSGNVQRPSNHLPMDAFVACTGSSPANPVASYPALQLDWDNQTPFNPDVIGFNPSYEASSRSYGDFEESRFGHLVDLFTPGALRFPPGSYASFYDWNSQLIDEELAKRYSRKPMLGTIQAQRRDNGGKTIIVNYRSFLSLARSRRIRPFVVLNIYTRGVKDALDVVARVKQEISSPINWEMGNELSHSGYASRYPRTAWNADMYVERMTAVSHAIKKQYPEDVIGVEGAELHAPRGYNGLPGWIVQYTRKWRDRVSENGNDFDAVIFHPYLDLLENVVETGIRDQRTIPACSILSNDARRAVAQYQWLFSAAQEVPKAYKTYVDRYYPNKLVWLTELGILRSGQDELLDLGPNGVAHAMFNIVYFAHWVKNLPNLRAYMFHVLDYGRHDFAALNLDKSLNANSVSFLFMQRLLGDATKISVQSFTQGARLHGVGPYRNHEISTVVALLASGPKGKRALVVNLGFSEAKIASPFESTKTTIVGGSPDSTIAPATFWSMDEIPNRTTAKRLLYLPPMSITLAEPAS